ncbi:MAG: SCO family protein [Ignavibacteriaceae bacterium]|mgnify:CR=1 FL=1|nr:SCO family protein [Ignavibacteriaceae bacterium]HRI45572.1 SCO family protein [Ignavibacteriaceae bacterium]
MRDKKNFVFFFLLLLLSNISFSAEQGIEVGIDERLGEYVAIETLFKNEDGEFVQLKELINKPTILMFVYYECPGICNPLMSEVASLINKVDLIPGKDYQILSISFDQLETPEIANRKKIGFLNAIKKKIDKSSWHFLTGDSINISEVTKSAGFYFKRDGKDFLHAGALIFIASDGKITRYLPGTTFLPFDIKMALIETSEGKVTPTIAKVLKFCFSYDAQGKKYALNVTRIAATITIIIAVIYVIFLSIKPRKKEKMNKGI